MNIGLKSVTKTVSFAVFFALALATIIPSLSYAQNFGFGEAQSTTSASSTEAAVSTSTEAQVVNASSTVIGGITFEKKDVTLPEQPSEKEQVKELLNARPAPTLTPFNFFAYWIQKAIAAGVPVNTIVLILLIPVFATIVTFVRTVIGLPSLEMLVPIVLAYVFVAVDILTSLVVLTAIILAAFVSRRLLKSVQVMFFAKRSISLMFLSFFVLAALTFVAVFAPARITELSIFPILMLTLLGDSIVAVHLHKSIKETSIIAVVTIVLGLIGYVLATAVPVRDLIVLYPEVVLLTLGINYLIGRYFGLRLTEVVRFKYFKAYGSE